MKTAIISINAYTKNLNFACPLHSYAFQQFLLINGIECEILDYKPNYDHGFNAREPLAIWQRYCGDIRKKLKKAGSEAERAELQKQLERYEMYLEGCRGLGDKRKARYDKFQNFIDNRYIRTEKCYDTALLEMEDPGFDCYICATDVIWRCPVPEGFDLGFFLASRAMENKWKIAYAASRGVPREYTEEEERQFFHYLEDFDAISVREESLKTFIEDHSGLCARTVLDPVLLHDAAFYEKILVRPPEEHYILLYYVQEKATGTIEAAAAYARKHGMRIVEITDIPLSDGRLGACEGVDHIYRYDVGVEEWLGYLRYADYVFTNSFHATCFCILFQKEFRTGFRMGDKLSHLLKQFGLSKRKIRKGEEAEPESIDYEKVSRRLLQKREASSDFILNALHSLEGRTRPVRDYDTWKKSLMYPLSCNTPGISGGTVTNDGNSRLPGNDSKNGKGRIKGWLLRVRIVDTWFFCRKDGGLIKSEDFVKEYCSVPGQLLEKNAGRMKKVYLRGKIVCGSLRFSGRGKVAELYRFGPGEAIPYIPVGQIDQMVADPWG